MIKETIGSLTVFFDTHNQAELSQVGGKALSLIQMTRSGLPVPGGFVLTAAFFQPWLDQVQRSQEWMDVLNSPAAGRMQRIEQVKAAAYSLPLEGESRAALSEALARLMKLPGPHLFAVRSSSPEEDLEEASFAGGYVTILGVTPEKIEDAVRQSFVSCLDERVLVYKHEHGLDISVPRIAVIVQSQVASEKAGVGFSLNPLNNDYDEAVINANFGLGESVVSGQVSPDTFIVNKVSRSIVGRKLGAKQASIWLKQSGGTYEQASPQNNQFCLSDNEVLSLTALLKTVEDLYQKPVDIEWAIAHGELYLLQARPVTAYFPVPEQLRTKPGERRNLYVDFTLTKWGMNDLMSVLGLSFLERTSDAMLRDTFGNISKEAIRCLRIPLDGRVYINLSNTIKLQGKKAWMATMRTQDILTAETVRQLDERPYLPRRLPSHLNGFIFKAARANLRTVWRVLQALRDPHGFEQKVLAEQEQLKDDLNRLAHTTANEKITLSADQIIERLMHYIAYFMPALYTAVLALNRMQKTLDDLPEALSRSINFLERGLPHNITVQMGLEMFRLSQYPEIRETGSCEEFLEKLNTRVVSAEFRSAWEQFILDFGFRGPMEMDPAVARFTEMPDQLFDLLHSMSLTQDAENNSQALYEKAIALREQTCRAVVDTVRQKSGRKARQFIHNYETFTALGGFRETGKYFFVLMTYTFRKRALLSGQALTDAGRLDSPEDVFGLTLEQLEQALADPSLDLRSLVSANNQYWKRFSQIREFPAVFDSRGRILRPPSKPAREGEIQGEPISAGTVTGRVKVLCQPDEKPLLPGEILVTRATDPGWTPLFINAGGILLEVGGMLQHGAQVAREYGKPCVAGIENATDIFRDGQLVEMDGSSGLVKIIGG